MAKKGLKKAFGKFFDCHLKIDTHLNIAKYLNFAEHIFESVKLSKRDKDLKR